MKESSSTRNLTRFPLEVVLRVVSHMNHYTVMAFLRALTEYRKYAILVTDHILSPLFFDLDDLVERRCLPELYDLLFDDDLILTCEEPLVSPEELFTPVLSQSHPIRLFELDEYNWNYCWTRVLLAKEDERNLGNTRYLESSWLRNPGLNCTSFLFVDLCNYRNYIRDENMVLDRLEQRSGCKWHLGLPTSLWGLSAHWAHLYEKRVGTRHKPALVISGPLIYPLGDLKERLVNLKLQNVAVVSNLILPCLEELSILYFEGVVSEVPVIEGLVSPKILRFVVHYDKQVPRFRRMHRVARRMFKWETKKAARELEAKRWGYGFWRTTAPERNSSSTRYFELCHIDSIGSADGFVSSDALPHRSNKTDRSFSFLKRFYSVNISGVPWKIMKDMNLSSTRVLRLTVTDAAGYLEDNVTIAVPKLQDLRVLVKSDNVTFPDFTHRPYNGLNVRVGATFVPNLKGRWQKQSHGYNTPQYI